MLHRNVVICLMVVVSSLNIYIFPFPTDTQGAAGSECDAWTPRRGFRGCYIWHGIHYQEDERDNPKEWRLQDLQSDCLLMPYTSVPLHSRFLYLINI